MDLWEFLNYYLDGKITCQIYSPSLSYAGGSYADGILFEGKVYDAIKELRTVAPNYDIEQSIEVDEMGVMYIPVEANY